jgi:hypothetical protein
MSYNEEISKELNDLRLTLLCQKFEQYFIVKGYKPNSNFDHRVFFLKNDQTFQSLIQNQTPYPNYEKSNKLLEILSEVNRGNDLRNLYVNTQEFTNKLSKTINDANFSIQLSDIYIKKNGILENTAKINELLNILNKQIKVKNNPNNKSKLIAYIISMNNFKSGAYRLVLNINTSFEQESDLNETEKSNLNKNNPENVYEIFKEVTLSTKNLINIEEGKNSILFTSNYSNNQKEEEPENKFEEYIFTFLNKDYKNYLVDKRYSGSTFSNFKLKISSTDGFYESNNEYLLHLLLSFIDDLCDLNKDTLTKNIILKVFSDNDYDKKDNKTVQIELNFELDNFTRMKFLSRINDLYHVTLDNKIKNQMLIDEILSDYFPDIKDSIKDILTKEFEPRDNCCSDCYIL